LYIRSMLLNLTYKFDIEESATGKTKTRNNTVLLPGYFSSASNVMPRRTP
jgi:hypothetical protein